MFHCTKVVRAGRLMAPARTALFNRKPLVNIQSQISGAVKDEKD